MARCDGYSEPPIRPPEDSYPVAMSAYATLVGLQRKSATLGSIGGLLGWDQETYMPAGGAEARSEQIELLSGMIHEHRTHKKIGELIASCLQDKTLTSDAKIAANLREMRRDYDLATKLPVELVSELAKTQSQAQEAWKHARADNDFAAFAPWLDKVLSLTRRKAECYGVPAGGEIYDALLDEYEPGMTARQIDAIFTPLQDELSQLVAKVVSSPVQPKDKLSGIDISQEKQHAFGTAVLKAIGFDLHAGRLDTTAHPFCSGFAPGDTRLTTRYNTSSCMEPLSSTMHEAGHGMYEQGLPKKDLFGTPLADAISLGIHESQSRMWENLVGRSKAFWQWALPVAKEIYGPAISHLTVDDVYAAVNQVERSYIRVEADEMTYNLHIMLRFGLERQLIRGDLAVKDLPGEWNSRFTKLLGLTVPDDKRGCLQDVHWSFGLVGYFPTYTLGNLYAAQFWETINQQIPSLTSDMARGDFGKLKSWLNTSIHAHGRQYSATELVQRTTGKPLDRTALMSYLKGKAAELYSVK